MNDTGHHEMMPGPTGKISEILLMLTKKNKADLGELRGYYYRMSQISYHVVNKVAKI